MTNAEAIAIYSFVVGLLLIVTGSELPGVLLLGVAGSISVVKCN